MKKKLLAFVLCLAILLTLIPAMSFAASAESAPEPAEKTKGRGEVLTFNGGKTAFSPHFILTAGDTDDEGWYADGDGFPIVIEAESSDIVITAIDAVIREGGEYYSAAKYSSGKKVETGNVGNGSTVHVRDIYTNRLEINNNDRGYYFVIDKITVYYTEIIGSEEIVYNRTNYDESEHFTVSIINPYPGGWYPGAYEEEPLVVEAKDPGIMITAIDAVIYDGAENYAAQEYSSGEKVETGAVAEGATVHVKNIFSNRLEINNHSGIYCEVQKITVYYTETDDSEVITYNQSTTAESDHFTITNNDPNIWGWFPGLDDYTVVVESKTDDMVITAIDVHVTGAGECYYAAEYSSGEKVETGPVEDDTTVHVKNIFSNRLEISSRIGQSFGIDKITIYYAHVHDYRNTGRDNGNGTHFGFCKCGEKNPEMQPHVFDGETGLCVCGLHEYDNPQAEVIHFDTDNVYGIRCGTESEHFSLKSNSVDIDGWYVGIGNFIKIQAKDENTTITAIKAIVGRNGEYFSNVSFSSGETVDTTVYNYNSTNVFNVNSDHLEMVNTHEECVQFRDITVYYTVPHEHSYTYKYVDNLDGTHTGMCVCREIGDEAVKHTYDENGVCVCGAANYYDIFEYNNCSDSESEHFHLNNNAEQKGEGWTVGNGHTIYIEDKNPKGTTNFITGVDLVVKKNGGNYPNVVFKGRGYIEVGTKKEKGAVEDGTVVHLTNFEAQFIEISCNDGEVSFGDITVYYNHEHDFSGQPKDNGDGTHSRKCIGCDEYGEPAAHSNIISGKCPCGAIIPGELIAFNNSVTAESERFTLSNDAGGGFYGWRVGNGHTITIDSKYQTDIIASIDVEVNTYGENYANVKYSSGKKEEWISGAYSGFIAHVKNINSTHLEISCPEGNGELGDITVYYLHNHDFSSGEGKDNGDGTHSLKCIGCNEYGTESFSHSYRPVEKVSDNPLTYTARCTICGNKIDNFQIKDRSYTYTSTTTYSSIKKGETMAGGTSVQAKYFLGEAKMIVYVDGQKVDVVEEGKYWTAPQCVECLDFESHWSSSAPLEIWFKSICDYTFATCEDPETCVYCRSTRGEALGHDWAEATCTNPKTCLKCGITEGSALGHILTAPDCTTPEFCLRCHEQFGPPAHDWVEATCTNPKTCLKCGITEGSALGHILTAPDCTTPEFCLRCRKQFGPALGHTFEDGVCTVCGAKAFEFGAISLVLSGELGLNFYTKVNDIESVKDGFMLFEIGNKGETQRVNFSDAKLCEDGRYVFRCNVNALQMADKITVSFHYGDTVIGPRTTSVADYINTVIQEHYNDDTDPTVKLAKAIINYGHYAQLAQEETRGFAIGTDYAETTNLSDVAIANAEDLAQYKATKTGNIDGITNISRSLSLDHGTDINLYFAVTGNYAQTVAVTDKNGKAVDCFFEHQADGRYLLVIPQIAAHQLGDMYTVTVDGSMTINVSALSYAYSVLASGKTDAQKQAVSALYEYYKATAAYKNAQ